MEGGGLGCPCVGLFLLLHFIWSRIVPASCLPWCHAAERGLDNRLSRPTCLLHAPCCTSTNTGHLNRMLPISSMLLWLTAAPCPDAVRRFRPEDEPEQEEGLPVRPLDRLLHLFNQEQQRLEQPSSSSAAALAGPVGSSGPTTLYLLPLGK